MIFICVLALLVLQATAVAQPAIGEGIPALKVTAPNGKTNVLIGSLHIPADGLRQPAASVMDGAQRYVVEGVLEPMPETSPLNALAPEVTQGLAIRANWSMVLTDVQIGMLRQNVRCSILGSNEDLTMTYLLTRKSAATAADIAIRPCATPGLISRDDLLARAASARGLQPLPLESQAQANKQRVAVPERIYQYQLVHAFTPESHKALRKVVRALNTGAYEEITKVMREPAPSSVDHEIFFKLMVTDRNRAWMPILMQYLDEGHTVVNVGAAHLPGPEGLISMLRGRGYKVEPILLEAGNPR